MVKQRKREGGRDDRKDVGKAKERENNGEENDILRKKGRMEGIKKVEKGRRMGFRKKREERKLKLKGKLRRNQEKGERPDTYESHCEENRCGCR